jgi:hypothetical protein
MDFEDDKYVVMNMGAGRSDMNFESNKVGDLCPNCWMEVSVFIDEGLKPDKPKPVEFTDVERARQFLRDEGYVVYKPTKRGGKR